MESDLGVAQFASAYDYDGTAALQHAAEQEPGSDMRLIPGHKQAVEHVSALFVFGFKIAIVAVIFFVFVCGVRVWLSASTVEIMQTSETLQTQIREATATAHELEIKHSTLANSARIACAAEKLGMTEPKKTVYMKISLPSEKGSNHADSAKLADNASAE